MDQELENILSLPDDAENRNFISFLYKHKPWSEATKKKVEELWGEATPLVETFIFEGSEKAFDKEMMAQPEIIKNSLAFPKYNDAKQEWDLLLTYQSVVEYFLKGTNETVKWHLSSPLGELYPPGLPDNSRPTLFDRILILTLMYDFIHSGALKDKKKNFDGLAFRYGRFLLFSAGGIQTLLDPSIPSQKTRVLDLSNNRNEGIFYMKNLHAHVKVLQEKVTDHVLPFGWKKQSVA